ncbi:unnamed protein product [Darwinula stevensoni]|uniref:Uncharacterized protein n=1 Tax=Darwinula stevensoni TaxID=69355 RepID=A0A7R9A3A1_9CRUS|nr:unnamed protein product [Darwinula stevensoni]CAG0880892.1 unnamed protein product [Darwinula stevensoni]
MSFINVQVFICMGHPSVVQCASMTFHPRLLFVLMVLWASAEARDETGHWWRKIDLDPGAQKPSNTDVKATSGQGIPEPGVIFRDGKGSERIRCVCEDGLGTRDRESDSEWREAFEEFLRLRREILRNLPLCDSQSQSRDIPPSPIVPTSRIIRRGKYYEFLN